MRYLRVKNLGKYQPQSTKRLPWIKLMTELLEPTRQPWYSDLPDATKALLHHVWLMAAVFDGRIPEDWLTRERLNLKSKPSLESILTLGVVWFENEDGTQIQTPSRAISARSGYLDSVTLLPLQEEEPSFSQDQAFDTVWSDYPRRIGRKEALRHFRASVKGPEDYASIRTALAHYRSEVEGRDMRYIKHGSAWFNNWRDWVNAPPPPPARNGLSLADAAGLKVGAEHGPRTDLHAQCGKEVEMYRRELRDGWWREECSAEQAAAWLDDITRGDITSAPSLSQWLARRSA